MDETTIKYLIWGGIAIGGIAGLSLLWGIFLGGLQVAINLFAWAAEHGFVGVAAYIACWVFMFPLMLGICAIGGLVIVGVNVTAYFQELFAPKNQADLGDALNKDTAFLEKDDEPQSSYEKRRGF